MAERRAVEEPPPPEDIVDESEGMLLGPEQLAAPTVTVTPGYDTATIIATSPTSFPGGWIQYGTATGVYTSGLINHQKTIRVVAVDGTVSYVLTFKLTGLQQNAAQAYFAQIVFNDRTTSSEVTWTQPGLNSSPNDQVFFYDRVLTDFSAIMNWSNKASSAGWMLPDQWVNYKNLVVNTAWYNYVKWFDGR